MSICSLIGDDIANTLIRAVIVMIIVIVIVINSHVKSLYSMK